MAGSSFYNPHDHPATQGLLMDLAEEMIKLYGIDMTYIIRNRTSTDNLFGESVSSEFKTAVVVEMYLLRS